MSRTIHAVDLFAGAGGTSTGLALACKELGQKVELTAINHELSAAMGFPKGYAFKGTKTQVIKQIGNAVVVDVAKALVKSLLSRHSNVGKL
mgnify:CR=1 FL=1